MRGRTTRWGGTVRREWGHREDAPTTGHAPVCQRSRTSGITRVHGLCLTPVVADTAIQLLG